MCSFFFGNVILCVGETFAELQEKARGIVAEWELEADNPFLVLLEDLCKEGDRIREEARRDREDLIQQVSWFLYLFLWC